MLARADISAITGYLSIATWLGAQAPQLLTNYKLKSVEGLSITFLFNWFMGDGTNLLGCILTRQLPFQTFLATYFVSVDAVLLGQYIYYGSRGKKRQASKSVLDIEEEVAGDEVTSSLLGNSVARSYASISTIEGGTRGRKSSLSRSKAVQSMSPMSEQMVEAEREVGANEFEGGRSVLASFYSERSVASNNSATGGQVRHASKHKQVGWAPHLEQGSSAPRGRSAELGTTGEELRNYPSHSRSRTRHNQGRSATTSTIVFMGVWALFGFRSYRDGFPPSFSLSSIPIPQGQVLQPLPNYNITGEDVTGLTLSTFSDQPPLPRPLLFVSPSQSQGVDTIFEGPLTPQPPKEEPRKWDKARTIGRISAWVCTTFYFTSRMPQIWKNFVRKSCAGLSSFLFLFAFLGNFFYVISILTSDEAHGPEATTFILESLPYLIGSGGTLSFDVVILTQAYIYRGRKPRRIQLGRLNSRSYSSLVAASRSASRSRTRERSVSQG